MTPGFARSMKCGITPLLPSGRVVTEAGTQAAACGSVVSTWPPTASARRSPSPVLARGAGEKCSLPVGACGKSALRRSTSCGNPPHASTTPRARVDADALAVALDHGADHAVDSTIELLHRRRQPQRDVEVHRRLRQASGERVAVRQRHAAAVAQHMQEVPRQALRDVDERLHRPERAHEVHDLLARAEHHSEDGQLGQRRRQILDAVPSSRPSNGRATIERPPCCPPGASAW